VLVGQVHLDLVLTCHGQGEQELDAEVAAVAAGVCGLDHVHDDRTLQVTEGQT